MYWKWTEDRNGVYVDDFGKRYQIENISDEEYDSLPDKTGFKKHWSEERFIELAGLRRYDP